jgi:hypothetical protein
MERSATDSAKREGENLEITCIRFEKSRRIASRRSIGKVSTCHVGKTGKVIKFQVALAGP